MQDSPSQSVNVRVDTIRSGLACDRCGRYVGQLGASRYQPPLYPIATEEAGDDEGKALLEFEWHMLGLLRQGRFRLAHPERDGRCVSLEEWAEEVDPGDDARDERE